MFFTVLLTTNLVKTLYVMNKLSYFLSINERLLLFYYNLFFVSIPTLKSKISLIEQSRYQLHNQLKSSDVFIFELRTDVAMRKITENKIPLVFLHRFFPANVSRAKSSDIFLAHRQVLKFSNFVIHSDTLDFNFSNFYFNQLTEENVNNVSNENSSIRADLTTEMTPLNAQTLMQTRKQTDFYQFLENNPYQTNKEKNFLFFNTYYDRFLDMQKNDIEESASAREFFKSGIVKTRYFPLFFKRAIAVSPLSKFMFKNLAKQPIKANIITFNLLRQGIKSFFWNDLKLSNLIFKKRAKPSLRHVLKKKKPAQSGKKNNFRPLTTLNFADAATRRLRLKAFEVVQQDDFNYGGLINYTILFVSKWRSFFLLRNLGFFFSTVFEFSDANFEQSLANFKKELYSFNMKNELEKKVLRKCFFSNNIEYYSVNYDKLEVFLQENRRTSDNFLTNSHFFKFFIGDILKNKKWSKYEIKKNFWSSDNMGESDLSIRRVRFKPGYSVIWREAREVLKSNLKVAFRYQHKLTKFVLKFRKIVKHKLLIVGNSNFLSLVIKAKFFPDYETTLFFFKSDYVYLNLSPCANKDLQIFVGDFVQLIVTNKYYIFYKMLINNVLKKKYKFDNILKKKSFIPDNQDEKQRTNNYPKWILQNKNALDDIPKFLEVDFYTLSCIVLYEPFLWGDFDPTEVLETKFSVINMYNWKYIN